MRATNLHPDFEPEALCDLAGIRNPDMIWGKCLERYANGSLIQVKTRTASWAWYGMPAYHPGIFFRREVLGSSPYSTKYEIAADYDLVCRILGKGKEIEKINTLVSVFYRGGISEIYAGKALSEENEIRLSHFKIPAIAGNAIMYFKTMNAKLARVAWLRGFLAKMGVA